jgi:hypothetical protein
MNARSACGQIHLVDFLDVLEAIPTPEALTDAGRSKLS